LKGFLGALQKISIKSLEFHNDRGDFEKWAEKSLQDKMLGRALKKEKLVQLKGETLRNLMIKAVKKRLNSLSAQMQSATRYF